MGKIAPEEMRRVMAYRKGFTSSYLQVKDFYTKI